MAFKYWIGALLLVLLSSSVYVLLPGEVRIDVKETYTSFKVYIDDAWLLAGEERTVLYDGTTKMRANDRTLKTIRHSDSQLVTIIRTAIFKDNIIAIDTYTFDGSKTDVKFYPVDHSITILNGVGKILVYEVSKVGYYGRTIKDFSSPFYFENDMKVEWATGNYYSKAYRYVDGAKGKLTIKYRVDSDTFTTSARLFDPPIDIVEKVQDEAYVNFIRTNDVFDKPVNDKFKSFNASSKKVVLKDSKKKNRLNIKLNTLYHNKDLPIGPDVMVAEVQVKDWKKGMLLFEDIRFFDVNKNYSEVDKIVVLKYKFETVDCFEDNCTEVVEWIGFSNLSSLPEKNMKVGLFVNTKSGEHIEWIPIIDGVPVLEFSAWEVVDAVYEGVNISTDDSTPEGLTWKVNGSKLYEIGRDGTQIVSYDCSTPWDLSTCSLTGNDILTQDSTPRGLFFQSNGSKLYEVGSGSDLFYELDCSTPWNLSSCSYNSVSLSTQNSLPSDVLFKSDGTMLYEVSSGLDLMYQYSCTTPWDLSTCSYDSITLGLQDGTSTGAAFSSDGFKLIEVGSTTDHIYQYACTTPWNLSTCSYTNQNKSTQDSIPTGITFSALGDKIYEIGQDGDKIYESKLITGAAISDCGDIDDSGYYTLVNDVYNKFTCFDVNIGDVVVDCDGFTVKYSNASAGNAFTLTGGYDNITIKNCNIELEEPDSGSTYNHAIYAQGNHNVSILNNNITIPGVFYTNYYHSTIWFEASDDAMIENNYLFTAGANDDVITLISDSDNIVIVGNEINSNGTYGYGIRSSSTSSGHRIENNSFLMTGQVPYLIDMQYGSDDVVIHNNNFTSTNANGRDLMYIRGQRTNITNNFFEHTAGGDAIMYIASAHSSRIINNTVINFGDDDAFDIANTLNLVFLDNEINGSYNPLRVTSSDVNTGYFFIEFSGNSFNGKPFYYNKSLSNTVISDMNFEDYGQVVCSSCDNVTYQNVNLTDMSLTLLNSKNVKMYNVTINTSIGHALSVYGRSTASNPNIVKDSVLFSSDSLGYGVNQYYYTELEVHNSNITVTGSSSYGLFCQYPGVSKVYNSRLSSTISNVLYQRCSNSEIHNNYFEGGPTYTSNTVWFLYSSFHSVINNTVNTPSANVNAGSIAMTYADSSNFVNNTIIQNNEGTAIRMQLSDENNWTNNTLPQANKVSLVQTIGTTTFTGNFMNRSRIIFDSGTTGELFVYDYIDVNITDQLGSMLADAVIRVGDNLGFNTTIKNSSSSTLTRFTMRTLQQNVSSITDYNNLTINATFLSSFNETFRNLTNTPMFINENAVLLGLVAGSDPCTYTSGDWIIDCTDNCEIITPVDLGGNNFYFDGVGTFSTTSNISNWVFGHIGSGCVATCNGGCFVS